MSAVNHRTRLPYSSLSAPRSSMYRSALTRAKSLLSQQHMRAPHFPRSGVKSVRRSMPCWPRQDMACRCKAARQQLALLQLSAGPIAPAACLAQAPRLAEGPNAPTLAGLGRITDPDPPLNTIVSSGVSGLQSHPPLELPLRRWRWKTERCVSSAPCLLLYTKASALLGDLPD